MPLYSIKCYSHIRKDSPYKSKSLGGGGVEAGGSGPGEDACFGIPRRGKGVSAPPVLGQGMGLGLAITRAMLDEYGAPVRFAKPSHGFARGYDGL